jgi:hypothetical protein
MPRDKDGKAKPLSIEESRSLKGSAALQEEAEKTKAKKAAEEAQVKGTTESVVAKKVEKIIPTGEDQGPSAAPKPQSSSARAKRTMIAPQKKLRKKGLRPAKNRELAKGVMAVTVANETPKKRTSNKRKTTRSGKPLDPTTGKIDTSKIKPGRAAKVDGKVVRVDRTNIEEVKKAAVTTVLPTAGPEIEKPTYELPGAPRTVAEQGYSQSGPEHHERLKSLTGKAFLHLNRMQSTHGTDEYHSHHAAFNETHAHVVQLDHSMGEILKIAHTAASNPKHPDSPKQFAYAKQAAGERLGLGKKTMDARTERSQAGRAKRMERIRAEQAAKEGQ